MVPAYYQGTGTADQSDQVIIIPEVPRGYNQQVRPSCPECGASHTMSNSGKWLCGECGRQWLKHKRERATPDYGSRPACPDCGAYHARSHGSDWTCGSCGRQWRKARR